jgi:hypothetical protein
MQKIKDQNYGTYIMGLKMKMKILGYFHFQTGTELDIWQYIYKENIPIVPLYLLKNGQ